MFRTRASRPHDTPVNLRKSFMEIIFLSILGAMSILCLLAYLPKYSPPEQVLTPLELLKRETYLRALEGDKASREWVMKNMFEESLESEGPAQVFNQTPKKEVEDAILALSKIGYKAVDAKNMVKNALKIKSYNTSQQIILEVLRKR